MEINRVCIRNTRQFCRLNAIGTEHGPDYASVYLEGSIGPPIAVRLADLVIVPQNDSENDMPG